MSRQPTGLHLLAAPSDPELTASLGPDRYGELVALCVAGAVGEPELLKLSEARAEAILAAFGARDAVDLGSSTTGGLDPVALVDLAVALRVLGRNDEAAIVVDLATESSLLGTLIYVALLRALPLQEK